MTNKIKTVEEVVENSQCDAGDVVTGWVVQSDGVRNIITQDRQAHCEALCEMLEGLKAPDPRTSKHHPPIGNWTDCEACKEDFKYNQGIDQAIQAIKELYNQPTP